MRERYLPSPVTVCAGLLLALGLTQLVGYAIGSKALKGIGFASAMAPFPKVFSDVDGLETFASDFVLVVTDHAGQATETLITPELYSRLSGPYNRRNVYGAALSYAPRLPDKMWQMVFCYAFHSPGTLRAELGIPDSAKHIAVRVQTKTRGRSDRWTLDPNCSPA